ncbi:sex-regulated protein janus-A-like [Ornithodoros turicata]|uniref:sex-regulated protein janus-A-like n=1 Tax=Ornithodoros turicata TaxID=34597 RepID=UPI0031387786
MAAELEGIPLVNIEVGRSRYILLKVYNPADEEEHNKYVVRGSAQAPDHAHVLEAEETQLKNKGLACECLGGGYIVHLPDTQELKVYGTSQRFGQADHSKACDILRTQYPDYKKLTWSNETL